MTIITLLIISGLVILDQLSKLWAVAALGQGRDILLWKNIFHLTYIENRGAAFGMLQGKQWFLISMTILVLIAIIIYFRKIPSTPSGKWMKLSFVLIISGAIGNLIDRISLSYVRDFLYFRLIDFPVFNVADIFVVVGVGILLVVIIFGEIDTPQGAEE
ncbi:signal peptidase II [Cellulosilyticum sp. I15G10I2]|uniref:signal peptidase II n=1 Tax=Cellulosilyticum sp. I15G10I2 TaxID=1892843 RepID=UPI00085C0187|nr:signal peptidase II [Cellulosilyticum sp. I15G10I2]